MTNRIFVVPLSLLESISPYVIANYFINSTGGPGISISNSAVYFVIENVTIIGATNNEVGGIELYNTFYGVLRNNTISNCYTVT